MKNKGFTLIELLAVITILSVILMIVVISVSSIITNSKNSLQKTQYDQILKAAEYYNNKEGLKDNDICVNVSYLTENGYLKEDEIKNPKNGKKIEGSVKIKYNGKKYTYEYRDKDCSICKAVDGEVSTTPGTKYSCEVKDNTNYTFYVLSEESDKVNLIMNRNICEDGTVATEQNKCLVACHAGEDNNNYGPDTAMIYLYNATKNWSNVLNMELTYTDENNSGTNSGYTGITTSNGVATITGKNGAANTTIGTTSQPLKARLPKENEVSGTDGNHCTGSNGSCPAWLVEYLSDSSGPSNNSYYSRNELISGINGYWLLSSGRGHPGMAGVVQRTGFHSSGETYNANEFGVRPVITVSKSDLQ